MAAWIVCILSMERFTAVYFPINAKQWMTRKNAAVVVLLFAIIQALIDMHYFWTMHFIRSKSGKVYCSKKYRKFLSNYWPWINLPIYALIPFTILIATSCAIIVKIAQNSYQKQKSSKSKESHSKVSHVTITLLSVSFMYILTVLPGVAHRISVNNFVNVNYTDLDWAREYYKLAIFSQINWINNSCNFCLYVLLSPSFRKELFGLFYGMLRAKNIIMNHLQRIHPT